MSSSKPEPNKDRNDTQWLWNIKLSVGFSLNNITISPYWLTFKTPVIDQKYTDLWYKYFYNAYGVAISIDILNWDSIK